MELHNYWWLLFWLLIAGALFTLARPFQKIEVFGKQHARWRLLPAIILICPYIVWAAFRSNYMPGDTAAYRSAFLSMPTNVVEWGEYMMSISKDKGFSLLSLMIKLLIGNMDIVYFFIIAAIQLIIVAVIYRKYSCNYLFSIFVFIATTDYISWVNNGMRQFLAVTIIFAGTGALLKKRYKVVVLLIILAATMHASALLMLPIIFIIKGKAWNKKTILLISLCFLALVFVDQFTGGMEWALSDTQYTNMVTDWQSWNDDGTNPLRVLVYSIPAILSLVGLKRIRIEDNPVLNLAANASIVTAGLYIISMGTSGIFMGRLPIYTSLYAMGILLPWEIEHLFTEESAKIVYVVTIIGFVVFFYYQMHAWGLL